MKLLLDQNLSYKMLPELEALFPGSTQVKLIGLDQADDYTIWCHARDEGYTIVTKDSDFHEFSLSYGSPPKVIWLQCGNRPKWYMLGLLTSNKERIESIVSDSEITCLEIY